VEDDVAHWLEMAEARAYADVHRATAALPGDPLGAGLVVDDEFVAFWLTALDFGFFNRCIGLGIAQPASEVALDRVIAAYRAAGRTQYAIQVSPFARPAQLEAWLVARGFRPGGRWAKVWRSAAEPPAERTNLRIEAVGPDRRADWERVVMGAFGMPEIVAPVSSVTLGLEGWHHYLSFDGDVAIGAAAMQIAEGVAWLGYGSTLESHRGRGSQSALFARRIRDAGQLGARLLITETGEDTEADPNPSYHNMRRAGFRLGYLRRNWLPPQPPVA
jgi:hypothetical protein